MTAWICKTPRGRMDPDTLAARRKDSIERLMWQWGYGMVHPSWQQLHGEGYTCVKVELTEL